jgi:glycosyltransferase involved in cell wall biosynthesis
MMDRPLDITLVQGAFLPVPALLGGAVEKVWHALGQEFARGGHRVVHVSRAHPSLPARNEENGVEHRRVRGYETPRSLWRLKLLDLAYSLRARRALPPADILVTNTFWLPAIERRRSRGRPYVHVARYPKGQLRLYPRRAVLQTVSEPIRAAILREISDAARVRVIPYPLSPVYLVSRDEPRPIMLYTGRLHPEKGVHLLIDAFARAASGALRGWTLRLIGPWKTSQGGGGDAYRETLAAAAAKLTGRVELLEPIFDERQLVSHYRSAAVFVYPSQAEFGETFGLSVLEAMAAGCAPVVSALGCFGDFVRPGENGLVFDHRAADPAGELSRSLQQVATSREFRERLRAAAWQTARSYTLPEIAARFIEDFRNILEPLPAAGSYLNECLPNSR